MSPRTEVVVEAGDPSKPTPSAQGRIMSIFRCKANGNRYTEENNQKKKQKKQKNTTPSKAKEQPQSKRTITTMKAKRMKPNHSNYDK
jgi:hypothetical protein